MPAGAFFNTLLVSCPVNNLMNRRRAFCCWRGATTSSGGPHGRRSNEASSKKPCAYSSNYLRDRTLDPGLAIIKSNDVLRFREEQPALDGDAAQAGQRAGGEKHCAPADTRDQVRKSHRSAAEEAA